MSSTRSTRFAKLRLAACAAAVFVASAAGTASAQPNNNSDTQWTSAQVKQLCDLAGGTFYPGSWHYGCIFPDGTILDCSAATHECTSSLRRPKQPPRGVIAVATVAATTR